MPALCVSEGVGGGCFFRPLLDTAANQEGCWFSTWAGMQVRPQKAIKPAVFLCDFLDFLGPDFETSPGAQSGHFAKKVDFILA